MRNEVRNIRLSVRLSETERRKIEEKMKNAGITNMAGFIRAMTLNGYIMRVDLPEIREMIRLLSNMTNNLNQIAKRVNAHGNIYETEIDELREKQQELWLMMRQLLSRLDTA